MLTELVLASSSIDPVIYVWDFRSGTVLLTFKQNTCYQNDMALLPFPGQSGRAALVMAAQTDKPLIHVYSWQKEQVHQKFVCPETLFSLAITGLGSYCAGGTGNGKIYIWELSTGNLCKVFDAHYRKVNILRFTSDDAALISGSEDAGINIWLLSSILDESTNEIPSPYSSWTSHSLPITDIICGIGNFRTARILTSSLDNTCKLWDLSTGHLLTTFIFPTNISSLALDPAERSFFAAGGDNLIYQMNLYRRREESGYMASRHNYIEAVGGAGDIEDIGMQDRDNNRLVFSGHNARIITMTLTYDGTLLLSGSEDGNVLLWDIASRQILKTFTHHKGPVTNLCTFLQPPDLSKLGISMERTYIQPIMPFKRIRQDPSQQRKGIDDTEDVTMFLNDRKKDIKLLAIKEPIRDPTSTEYHDLQKAKNTLMQLQSRNTTTPLQSQINELQSELLRVHDNYQKVKGLHNEMYQGLVEEFMRRRKT
ncbi:hypothetical protein G9A89_023711 [Geosiphon pyriformis]|nr:hypothetical protein G9A89_023711 [Geosiphon pyriformis]